MTTLVGIDLGGRTTGRTAVSVLRLGGEVAAGDTPGGAVGAAQLELIGTAEVLARCGPRDAAFVDLLLGLEADVIGVDAPLSLPDVHTDDYLRRPGDRALGALSPFTLGELTARALHLRHRYGQQRPATPWLEVYPKAVAALLLGSARGYKQSAALQAELGQRVSQRYGWALPTPAPTGDDLDSVLALVAVWHHHTGAWRNHAAPGSPPLVEPV